MESNRPATADEVRLAQQIANAMGGICLYLDAHPDASDSLRGVRLWLRGLAEEPSEEALEVALERLAEQGEIEARPVAGGAIIYGRTGKQRQK